MTMMTLPDVKGMTEAELNTLATWDYQASERMSRAELDAYSDAVMAARDELADREARQVHDEPALIRLTPVY